MTSDKEQKSKHHHDYASHHAEDHHAHGHQGDPSHGVEDVSCLEVIDHMHAYLDGELGAKTVAELEGHMQHCRACFSRAEFEKAVSEKLKREGGDETPDALKDKVNKLIDLF